MIGIKTAGFSRHNSFWKRLQVSFKISSAATETAVGFSLLIIIYCECLVQKSTLDVSVDITSWRPGCCDSAKKNYSQNEDMKTNLVKKMKYFFHTDSKTSWNEKKLDYVILSSLQALCSPALLPLSIFSFWIELSAREQITLLPKSVKLFLDLNQSAAHPPPDNLPSPLWTKRFQ